MSNFSDNNRLEELKRFDESKKGVKGLSDSGITSIPRIFIHSKETLTDLSPSLKSISIPIIDLSKINTDDNHRLQIIAQVKEAASNWGFFQVINHGISQPILDSTLKAIKSFHEQPHEVKSKYYKRQEASGVMFASNNDLYRAEAASWHDSLSVWMGPVPVNPDEIPEICRKEVIEWDVCAKKVGEAVMELLSEGLGLEKGKFKELSFSESRALVGHCYPYCPQPDLTVGITAHTDPGVVTVLLQDEIGGLQVKYGDGWVDVKPVHGALIINVGDFLQIVSNGKYKSVQHRVLANSCKEPRTSVVEFFNLSNWKGNGYFGPLPELLSPEKPAIYRDFTKQEFLENFYNKGLDSKSLVDKVKIQN
ncbi:hypothetical protein JCGZ_06784 [Jatropha curcas]|uniref:Uncharacterized protein n=1 Tax=Jatropha curcas TaxID=180498 RepID=A0A067KYJ2_JATCU|nr:hypothetical protein JCGZ_06784 [Jatropha curcas]